MNKFLINLSLILMALPLKQCRNVRQVRRVRHGDGAIFGIDWTHQDQDDWYVKWPECAGKQQSPIDIDSYAVIQNPDLILNLSAYDVPRNVLFKNNGGSGKVELDKNSEEIVITVGKGTVLENYVFVNMHFHWGDTTNTGSEHTIDAWSQGAEIHFVHFNQKHKSIRKALDKEDGIVVIGLVLRNVQQNQKPLIPLISKTPQIEQYGSEIKVDNFNLGEIFPSKRNNYYSYEGSLTTPPCSQTVTWFVFAEISKIGELQIDKLRQLKDPDGNPIMSNFRKIQPINGRLVDVYVDPGTIRRALKFLAKIG